MTPPRWRRTVAIASGTVEAMISALPWTRCSTRPTRRSTCRALSCATWWTALRRRQSSTTSAAATRACRHEHLRAASRAGTAGGPIRGRAGVRRILMRVVGLETEYGITDPSNPGANPILLSSQLVQACRVWSGNSSTRWDYGGEDPLMDLRGMRRERRYATADLLTDSPEYSDANRGVTLRRRRGSWEDPAHLNAVLGQRCALLRGSCAPRIFGSGSHQCTRCGRVGRRRGSDRGGRRRSDARGR